MSFIIFHNMNKFSFCAFLCAACFLIACGDSNDAKLGSKKSSKTDLEYKSFREIPSCDEKLNGKKAHVADLELNLVCENGKWVEHRVDTSSHETRAFVAPSTVVKGTMTDSRDCRVYKTVKIGSRTWMAENLNYKVKNSYCYNDSAKYCAKYGRFYTWAAAMVACPLGWHLPTKEEFKMLIDAVGGKSIAGKMLKSANGWIRDDNGTDDYSFGVLPAGDYGYYKRFAAGYDAFFWSSSKKGRRIADYMELGGFRAYGIKSDDAKLACDDFPCDDHTDDGFSVRCVKDDVDEKGESGSSEPEKNCSDRLVDSTVTDLSNDTQSVVDPSSVVKGTMKDSRDGQKYKTVTIGSQVWMAQNLNYESTDSYCYNDSAEYCAKYGRLYTWAAAMDSVGAWSTNGKGCGYDTTCTPTYPVRGVCPSGWHLPTRDEFENLVYAVGGFATFNKMLKSTSGWDKDQNGIDSYSFTAYSSGFRFLNGYYSEKKGERALFWSSTERYEDTAYTMNLNNYDNVVTRLSDYGKGWGVSVRCVKD